MLSPKCLSYMLHTYLGNCDKLEDATENKSIMQTVRMDNSSSSAPTTAIKLDANHKGVSIITAAVFPSVIVAFHRDTFLS